MMYFWTGIPAGKHADVSKIIKKEISRDLGRHIDMTDRDALDDIGRRFILPEVVYVV